MKNFLDYTDEKITEKAFMQSLVVSVVGILICIVSLCSITYAWFSGTVSSGNNVLKSGSFDLKITAKDDTPTPLDLTKTNGVWSGMFLPGKTYTVTLSVTDTSTVKGYCAIITKDETTYINTEVMKYIADGESAGLSEGTAENYKKTITFTLTVTEETTIKFSPRWGIPANSEGSTVITDGCKVSVGADGAVTKIEP